MAYTTINKSTAHFETKLWTGTGSAQSITNMDFQPDFIWWKERSSTSNHNITDAVRGVSKQIYPNENNAETSYVGSEISAFNSDGFSIGTSSDTNQNGETYVSWNFKANGQGSSNTDGSQSSTVSVNTTAGFSIVKFVNNQSYTTNTFGHGLGAVPKLIIMRSLDSAYNWDVHHHKVAISKRLILNSTSAEASSTYMNSTLPTNQVFTVKSDEFDTNDDCIAYCFAEKTGYSKFGSYTGNGSDTQFIYLGFKPAFFLWKSTTQADHWGIIDNKRDTFNDDYGHELQLRPSESNGDLDGTGDRGIDFLSNGVCLRGWASANGTVSANESSQEYMFMAFASAPLVGSNNVPCTAK